MKYMEERHNLTVRGNTSFYRFVEARRAFGTLPCSLLGTAGPGDHAADGTALSNGTACPAKYACSGGGHHARICW